MQKFLRKVQPLCKTFLLLLFFLYLKIRFNYQLSIYVAMFKLDLIKKIQFDYHKHDSCKCINSIVLKFVRECGVCIFSIFCMKTTSQSCSQGSITFMSLYFYQSEIHIATFCIPTFPFSVHQKLYTFLANP